jgi:Ca2+-binding RTX toxin-like protein
MSLTTFNTNYLKGSYTDDVTFLLKIAENAPLAMGTNTSGLHPHIDGKQNLAIGYGYDFAANGVDQSIRDLTAAGATITNETTLRLELAKVTAGHATAAQQATIASLVDLQTVGVANALLAIAIQHRDKPTNPDGSIVKESFEGFLQRNSIDLPDSRERAVLMSMWYQLPGAVGKGGYFINSVGGLSNMSQALIEGNRAEVWYQIRYQSSNNGTDGVMRRFVESELFGLYETSTLDENQAKQIYAMYNQHHDDILDYESRFSNQIAQANSNYELASNELKVQSLETSLQKAADLLIQTYVPEALRSTISPLDIQLATDQQTDLSGGKRDGYRINTGQDQNDLLIGNEQSNVLNGLGGNDILVGGAGDDTLNGGTGNDTLIGGQGSDTYIYSQGDGVDTIIDSDGSGQIVWDLVNIQGDAGALSDKWKKFNTHVWQDQKNSQDPISYNLQTETDGSKTLYIIKNGDVLKVDNWQPGDLGISLGAGAQPLAPLHTYNGDQRAPVTVNNGKETYDWSATSWAADGTLTGGVAEENFNDVLVGSSDADKINGLGGNDALDGGAGNDQIDGGEGNDLIAGGAGSDIIHGGAGNDEILSATGLNVPQRKAPDDTWQVPAGKTAWTQGSTWGIANNPNNTYTIYGGGSLALDNSPDVIYGDAGDDHITGGHGDDYIDGGADNDVLWGNGGNDIIDGGTGDDNIYGDGVIGSGFYQTTPASIQGNDFLDGGEGSDWIVGGGKNDVLLGGAGNDFLWGDDKSETLLSGQYHGKDYLDGGAGDDLLIGGGNDDTLIGGIGNDTLLGDDNENNLALQYHGNDYLDGGAGDDKLYGGGGNDTLLGGSGNDTLYGDGGNDILDGGAGADILMGGAGDDIYLNVTGEDTLADTEGHNTIRLAQANSAGGLSVTNSGDQGQYRRLDIALDNGETLKIQNAFFGTDAILEFANGNQLDLETLVGTSLTTALNLQLGDNGGKLYGGAAADSLHGGSGDDILSGAWGNDTLNGGAGNDTLDGGAGRDLLLGGAGNDTYQLNAGSGADLITDTQGQNIIRFAADISAANLTVSTLTIANQPALQMKVNGVDAATITSGFDNYRFEFADGSRMTSAEFLLNFRAEPQTVYGNDTDNTLYGGQAADTLYGQGGNDTLWGGAGDDLLDGGLGSDDYHYRPGDGHDVIQETDTPDSGQSSQDRVIFGAGIALSDVTFNHQPNGDLSVTVAGLADAITVTGWYTDPTKRVEAFEFADDQQVTADTLAALDVTPLQGSAGNDRLSGTNYRDIIMAGAGDDLLIGNGGNDDLHGETGTDTYRLSPGSGADQVFEVADETSIIEVTAYNVSRLTGTRVGDDLLLGVTDADDSLTLKNFYTLNHDWQVKDQTGVPRELTALLAENTAYRASRSEMDSVQESFIAGIQDTVIQSYQAQGMVLQADGSWQTPLQITLSRQTESYARSPGYSGYVPTDANYYYLNTSGLTVGQFSVSTYSSDAAEINYSGGSLFSVTKNVQVEWGAPQTFSNSDVSLAWSGHYLYTTEEALALMESLGVNGIANPYVYTGTPTYTHTATTTQQVATALSVTPADGTGYDIYGVDPVSLFQLGNLPTTLAVTANNADTGVDIMNGGEGDNAIILSANFGIVHAGGGNDTIQSYARNALLDGGSGDDLIIGSFNDDIIFGGSGNDLLEGGAGNDRYYVMAGDTGTDVIYDTGISGGYGGAIDSNTVVLGEGINLTNFSFSWGSESLPASSWGSYDYNNIKLFQTLDIGWQADSVIRIVMPRADEDGYYVKTGIEFFEFADGSRMTMAQMLALAGPSPEHAPIINTALKDQIATEYIPFSYTIPENAFIDQDAGDVLSYSQNAWSQWLSFDSETRTFSGTPDANAIYPIDITVTATDKFGASISDTFTLTVNPINLIEGTTDNDTLLGTAAADALVGLSGSDILIGGEGDDVLYGGAGNDYLSGGLGNDVYMFGLGDGQDVIENWTDPDIAGNVDTLRFGAGIEAGDITFTRSGTDLVLGINGTSDQLTIQNWGYGDAYRIERVEFADGTAWDAAQLQALVSAVPISGTEQADFMEAWVDENATLQGLGGNDVLYGNNGNDILDGGAGNDYLSGSTGNDTYIVDSAGDIVVENADEGTDTVQSSISYTLGANVENLTLTGMAAINGTGNGLDNVLIGNSAMNTLTGGNGNDTLDGGSGADILIGGSGNDTYIVDNAGDVVKETSKLTTEIDTVLSSITYTLGSNVENLALTGMSSINGTGNSLNNILTGNSEDNVLNGGTGLDQLLGGLGNDTYVVDNVNDAVTENQDEGIDTVRSSVTYRLSDNIENLTLTGASAINGEGNDLDNILLGNNGKNVLDGGIGADAMTGGAGNDTYVVDNTGDVVTESANEGTDTVQSSITYTLGENVEKLTLIGTDALDGTGNALDNTLIGNEADNILDGSTGADTMIGGLGNDTYIVDNASDVVKETSALSTEIDTVQSSVTYTLGSNVENLILTGTAVINGTGNSLNNQLIGNSGDNVLTGGKGSDLLNGDLGNDTLKGNAGNDILQGGAGNDTLSDTAGANLLDGGSGIDTLSGSAANEIFVGGTGNDTITTGNGADIIAFNRGDGMDVVNGGVGTDNTLSLGGGIQYADLALSKSGKDLIVEVGNADQITLSGWYNTNANHKSVLNLQVVADAIAGFDRASSDPLLNKSIQNFDFTAIVNAFDQTRGSNANFMHWHATDSLLTAHLSASDSEALGGDLANQYGKSGNFSGFSQTAAQDVLNNSSFGANPQLLHDLSGLNEGIARLS